MATAVKNSSTTTSSGDPHMRLLRASAIGAVYVAACIAFVAFGIPYLWKVGMHPLLLEVFRNKAGLIDPADLSKVNFLSGAGLIVVVITACAALLLGGLAIAGPQQPEGFRAGVFTLVAGVLGIFLATIAVGQLLERFVFKTQGEMFGMALTIAAGLAATVYAVRYVLKPAFSKFLITFEHQGWFQAKTYKANQGLRVRRLTILAILVLVGSGVYTLIAHDSLPEGDWIIHLPFAKTDGGQRIVKLLPDVKLTVPLLLIGAGLWGGWRAVNFPTFADFLIATEAEMNKVSWTTRKRLVQDTIVVLITVAMFAIFLMFVDQVWGWLLTRETLGGIVPKAQAQPDLQGNRTEIPW
jgi:preprotein translocase SecE subunit